MSELKIGIQLSSLGLPLKKALQTAARLGANGIEIDARIDLRPKELSDTGRRQLKKMMDDLNLRVASVKFQTRRGYDVEEDLERRIDATKEAMRFAHSLGANTVVNQIGLVPEKTEHPAYSQLTMCLTDLARYGQHVGAMLAAETGSEPGELLAKLIESLPEKAIGITFNPGNLVINTFSVEDALKACAPYTLLVHVCDAVRDLARGRGVDVPLGRGSVDLPQLFATLNEQPYNGWFIVQRDNCDDPISEIGSAVSFLKEVLRN